MLNRPPQFSPHLDSSDQGSLAELLARLREGVAAMGDPVIEAKVAAYFARHLQYSRDLIHVPALACRFQADEKQIHPHNQSTSETAAGSGKNIFSFRRKKR